MSKYISKRFHHEVAEFLRNLADSIDSGETLIVKLDQKLDLERKEGNELYDYAYTGFRRLSIVYKVSPKKEGNNE